MFSKRLDTSMLDSKKYIPMLDKVPILMFAAEDDPLVPNTHAKEFYEAVVEHRKKKKINTPIKIIINKSDRHLGASFDDPQAYLDEVANFIEKNAKPLPSRTQQPPLVVREYDPSNILSPKNVEEMKMDF
jgi:hypothetical protein